MFNGIGKIVYKSIGARPQRSRRTEKPEKMVAEMQTLELIDELKTRKNGDDMSWDGFKL